MASELSELLKNGKYFAQIKTSEQLPTPEECEGKPTEEVTKLVASKLLGDSYKLEEKQVVSTGPGFEVFDILTAILPTLSEQSAWYWEYAARPLASLLESAKYPVRAQAAHLIFWWARLGGLNGLTVLGRTRDTRTFWTRDGSNTELSWQISHTSGPDEEANRRVRFAIDPFHPETGLRLAGGGIIDWLWGEGSMGLVDREGSKEWKDIIEKWLFPDLKSSNIPVPNAHYAIAFDLEPDGLIGLKSYYVPPRKQVGETSVAMLGHQTNFEPFQSLLPLLHPSLQEPFEMMCDYLQNEGVPSRLRFLAIASDLTTLDKNRVKFYFFPWADHSFKDVIRDMTLAGRLNGPVVDDSIANMRKLYRRLFPEEADNEDALLKPRDGGVGGLSYYYELVVGQKEPCPKVYFDMSNYGVSDRETTKAVERFMKDVGKPGAEGWYTSSMERAFPHRDIGARTGIQTGVTFGMKKKGWQITGYMSTELFAPEREVEGERPHETQESLIAEFYDVYAPGLLKKKYASQN